MTLCFNNGEQVLSLLNQTLSQDPTLSRTDARVRQIKDFASRIIKDARYNDDAFGEHDARRFQRLRRILRVRWPLLNGRYCTAMQSMDYFISAPLVQMRISVLQSVLLTGICNEPYRALP